MSGRIPGAFETGSDDDSDPALGRLASDELPMDTESDDSDFAPGADDFISDGDGDGMTLDGEDEGEAEVEDDDGDEAPSIGNGGFQIAYDGPSRVASTCPSPPLTSSTNSRLANNLHRRRSRSVISTFPVPGDPS